MDPLHFVISEYIRRKDLSVPIRVMDNILRYHIWAMNPVRIALNSPVSVSLFSGFRPTQHEDERGRGPTPVKNWYSEHCFIPQDGSKGWGAADYTCSADHMAQLAELSTATTDYSRFVFYPEVQTPFFHHDYKHHTRGKRFFVSINNEWNQVSRSEFLSKVQQVCNH